MHGANFRRLRQFIHRFVKQGRQHQFAEFGNAVWHHHCTGAAIAEVYARLATADSRLAAYVSATGSAGTIAAGDYLKTRHPGALIAASEALQCPTLLYNGYAEQVAKLYSGEEF